MTPQLAPKTSSRATLSYQDISVFLRRALPYMVVGVVATLALAFAYLLVTPTTYTATSSVIYDPVSAPTFVPNSRWLESNLDTSTRIDSQVEVIKSEGIAKRVIIDLNLARDPEFVNTEDIADAADNPSPPPATKDATTQSKTSGANKAADASKAPAASDAKSQDKTAGVSDTGDDSVPIPTPNSEAGFDPNEAKYQSNEPDPELALPAFLNDLKVRRVGLTSIIQISFSSLDARKATKIANAVAREYIAASLEQKAQTALDGSKWLQQRLEQLRKLAFDAMRKAEQFKASGGGLVSDSAVKLAELESIAETYRNIYKNFLLKLTETSQRVSYPVADARVVSLATLPGVGHKPSRKLIIVFAAVMGVTLGLAFAFAENTLNRRIYAPKDIAELESVTLGSVSLLQTSRKLTLRDRIAGLFATSAARFRRRQAAELSAFLAPDKLPEVWDILLPLAAADNIRQIGLVGLSKGAGVTSLAAKLAHNYQSLGRNTLLVDYNLCDRNLSRRFDAIDHPGFADLIAGEKTAEEAIVETAHDELTLMPVGDSALLPTTPGIIIAVNRKHEVLERLKSAFDICLFDLPPLDASTEALVVGPKLDAVLLVAEYGVTPFAGLDEIVEKFRASDIPFKGIIINKAAYV